MHLLPRLQVILYDTPADAVRWGNTPGSLLLITQVCTCVQHTDTWAWGCCCRCCGVRGRHCRTPERAPASASLCLQTRFARAALSGKPRGRPPRKVHAAGAEASDLETLDRLVTQRPEVIVVDEGHVLKNPEARDCC